MFLAKLKKLNYMREFYFIVFPQRNKPKKMVSMPINRLIVKMQHINSLHYSIN